MQNPVLTTLHLRSSVHGYDSVTMQIFYVSYPSFFTVQCTSKEIYYNSIQQLMSQSSSCKLLFCQIVLQSNFVQFANYIFTDGPEHCGNNLQFKQKVYTPQNDKCLKKPRVVISCAITFTKREERLREGERAGNILPVVANECQFEQRQHAFF